MRISASECRGPILRLLVLCLVALVFGLDDAGAQLPENELLGTYAVTIATEDIPPELIGGASLIGRWHITFGADDTYVLGRQDVGPLVQGSLDIAADRVTLRDEIGVIACEPGSDGNGATYGWSVSNGRLLLTAIEEPCPRRRLLLTTRTMALFVPCPPLAVKKVEEFGAAMLATPSSATPSAAADPESEIDTLLKQMSDCWATRQPERFLPLLSQEYRAAQTPDNEDAERRFTLNMGAPIVWELAGEIESAEVGRAEAMVRQTLGDNVDVVQYAFVFEDGAWRWDGAADAP